jgi:endonuclease III
LNIDRFIKILKGEYRHWTVPSITLIAGRGSSPFEILISTLLSLRTKDQVTLEAATRLFEKAKTPAAMRRLDSQTIETLIYPVGFYVTKAKRILEISRILMDRFGGGVPDDMDQLLELPGVGRKTANLVLVEGFGIPAICVDTHVHRISNRIGYVNTRTPERTEAALRKKLPRRHWIKYNELLVAFGQAVCRPVSPFCSRCPVAGMCRKIGVDRHR